MPFSNRVLESPLSYREFEYKEIQDTRLEHTLEKFSIMSMEGTLLQFAQVTKLAHDVFSSLAKEAGNSLDRCKTLSQRVTTLGKDMDKLSDEELATRIFVKTEATDGHSSTSKFLFMSKTRNEATNSLYAQASAPPSLNGFGEGCLSKYSDPFFFMRKWVEQETKKQAEAAERKRKRKEARKLKKKGKKGEKGSSAARKKRIIVDRVEKKKYNIYGPEFGDEEAAGMNVPQGRDGLGDKAEDVVISVEQDEYSASATVKHKQKPQQPPFSKSAAAPPLPPPPQPTIPSAAAAAATSTAAVPAPAPPSGAPAAPAAPPAPAPGELPSLPKGPAGLLGQIKTGVSLKKAQVVAAPKKLGLLDEIRGGKALKKVSVAGKADAASRRKSNEESKGVFGEISKLMERRKYIEDSGNEDSDDDGWDD